MRAFSCIMRVHILLLEATSIGKVGPVGRIVCDRGSNEWGDVGAEFIEFNTPSSIEDDFNL